MKYPFYLFIVNFFSMSADQAQEATVEQVTQEVKDVKLENGTAVAANGIPSKNEDNALPFKVM